MTVGVGDDEEINLGFLILCYATMIAEVVLAQVIAKKFNLTNVCVL